MGKTIETSFQGSNRPLRLLPVLAAAFLLAAATGRSQDFDALPALPVLNAEAASADEMRAYEEVLEHTSAKIAMVPIPGGEFLMGSPAHEPDRQDDEGPQRRVRLAPFWMAKFEITWDAYEVWMDDLDVFTRAALNKPASPRDAIADRFQISQPTKPYTDMSFGMGKRGYPAICMTQHSARTFCKWLSAKTGRYYRLPTEAEWEYACRAGTTTAYSFGDDPALLDDYAWHGGNSQDRYQRVGKKKPNPWGLYDLHGNVAEWVLDQYHEAYPTQSGDAAVDNPLAIPTQLYPRVVRGGGWDHEPQQCRSAARAGSEEDWSSQDPQNPKSIWYHTDALHVGFRVVRPLAAPTAAERTAKWDKADPPQIDKPRPSESN